MFSPKRYLLLLGLIPLSFASQADDMQFLQAANYYAHLCTQQRGTPYLSPDQGNNWHQIDLQEIARSAEHQKSLAVMNGLTEYLPVLFRWKPEINKSQWQDADEGVTRILSEAITTKPGRVSYKIEREEKE